MFKNDTVCPIFFPISQWLTTGDPWACHWECRPFGRVFIALNVPFGRISINRFISKLIYILYFNIYCQLNKLRYIQSTQLIINKNS